MVFPTACQWSSSCWIKCSLGQYCVDLFHFKAKILKSIPHVQPLLLGVITQCCALQKNCCEPSVFHTTHFSPGGFYGSPHTVSLATFGLANCFNGAFPLSLQFSVAYAILKQFLSKMSSAVIVLSSETLKSLKKKKKKHSHFLCLGCSHLKGMGILFI